MGTQQNLSNTKWFTDDLLIDPPHGTVQGVGSVEGKTTWGMVTGWVGLERGLRFGDGWGACVECGRVLLPFGWLCCVSGS